MKPILFNTEMVKAILDGRKSATRRLVKPQPGVDGLKYCYASSRKSNIGKWHGVGRNWKPPYRPGDILYVRETFFEYKSQYYYKADRKDEALDALLGSSFFKWHPSIHMPEEAARLFLRVTGVRVERVRDITEEDAIRDFDLCPDAIKAVGLEPLCKSVWNSTIKKADLPLYGWDANPWVWVIAFEPIGREEAMKGGGEG